MSKDQIKVDLFFKRLKFFLLPSNNMMVDCRSIKRLGGQHLFFLTLYLLIEATLFNVLYKAHTQSRLSRKRFQYILFFKGYSQYLTTFFYFVYFFYFTIKWILGKIKKNQHRRLIQILNH